MNGILFVLRTGCQWNALNATGICSSSTAHRRFQQWVRAGVFAKLWEQGLTEYDELKGIDWRWQAMDGAMTKAPLGGEKNRPQPHGSSQRRREAKLADRGRRRADRAGR
jgi:transposase